MSDKGLLHANVTVTRVLMTGPFDFGRVVTTPNFLGCLSTGKETLGLEPRKGPVLC